MKQIMLCVFLAVILAATAFPLGTMLQTDEPYRNYKKSDVISVKDIVVGEWRIDDASLFLDRIDERSSILAPTRGQGDSLRLEVVKARSIFQIIWLKIHNNAESDLSVLPFFLSSCTLVDEKGKSYEMDKRMQVIGALIPTIAPGGDKKFYLYYDVPKGTIPAVLKLGLIKSSIQLR